MRLFKEDNFNIVIDPEAKIIPEFKKIITSDKDRKKRNAHRELSYIYFMCDYRSPYSIYPKEERKQRLIKDLQFNEDTPVTKLVQMGMDKYRSRSV